MTSQQEYAERYDAIFKQRAEESEIKNNIEDFCPAPWHVHVDCNMHRSRLSTDWNDDDIRAARRSWLRGICPSACEGCEIKLKSDLDLIKHHTDPDGYTRLSMYKEL